MSAFGSAEWMAEAQAELARVLCPRCRRPGTLVLSRTLYGVPPVEAVGSRVTVSLRAEVQMACARCGLAGSLHEDSLSRHQ